MKVLLIMVLVFIAARQIPPLIRQKYWRELVVFIVFYSLAATFSFLISFDVKIPSPIQGIMYVIEDVLNIGYTPE
jgi:hypothetical protein